jgi:predicted Zn finger-like uncharacterized protein
MLFTRCPECETTFRVTDETLKKANGQVRCGRCASVFNAYAELHDPTAKTFEPESSKLGSVIEQPPPAASVTAPPSAVESPAPPAAAAPASAPTASAPPASAPPPSSTPTPPAPRAPDAAAASSAAAAVDDVAAEANATDDESEIEEQQAALDVGGAPFDADLSATDVERVLTSNAGPPLPQTAYVWNSTTSALERRPASRWWSVAVALAVLALGAQAIHYFRAELAENPTLGPWIAQTYAAFGSEIAPRYDVRQYQIVDWVATAEPNARGVGSLKITARIQNRGPQRQPYPAVQLKLKDRFEAAVASRMFSPAEYLPRDTPRGRLMSPGETARAELEVVDPGPDAYGFELDVCIEVEASLVTCGTDEVFL